MRSTDLFFGPRILFGGDDDGGSSGSGRDDARQGRGYNTDYSKHSGWRGSNYGNNGQGDNNAPSGTDNDASANNAAAQSDAQAAENRGVRSGMLNTNTGNSWVDANLNMDVGYRQGLGEKIGSFVPGFSFSHKENPNTMAKSRTEVGFNPLEAAGAMVGIPGASAVLGYVGKEAGLTFGPQAEGLVDRVVNAVPADSLTREFPGDNRQDNDNSTGTGSGGLLSGVSNGAATSGTGASGETPSTGSETDVVSNSVGAGLPSPTERFRGDRYLNGRWVRNATTGQLEWAAA